MLTYAGSASTTVQILTPALLAVTDASSKGLGWRRVGERIAYYENHFETESGQGYYTLTFTLTFPHANDVWYSVYCLVYLLC